MPQPGSAEIGFIGLGAMGLPMAKNLLARQFRLRGFDTRQAAIDALSASGGTGTASAAEAATGADTLILMVVNAAQAGQVLDTALDALAPGAVVILMATCAPAAAAALAARVTATGRRFIDAPVSGGQAGAENGMLTVMCGGGQGCYDKVESAIGAYARACRLMGPVGAGQLTKMVNQICIAGLVQGLSEGVHFAKKAGLDVEAVLSVISKGAAGSWQMENRGSTMNAGKFDFGFAVDWMRKDLGILLDEARRNGAKLPVSALVDQFYADVQAMGGNRWDTSSLVARLER